jgi:hypothetical protein
MSDTFTTQEGHIHPWLEAFDHNPALVMDSPIPKQTHMEAGIAQACPFNQQETDVAVSLAARDAFRRQLTSQQPADLDRAPYLSNDQAKNLVDQFTYSTVEAIHNAGLTSAKLTESPWSDDYWAIYRGILGCRYADPQFSRLNNWKAGFDYVHTHSASSIWQSGNAVAINLLSPSEKYDALVGDGAGSLTQQMWSEGKYYYDANGTVETWMGICHGWAPAAYMLKRPKHSISVKAADGKALNFYPSDIKALASLLWANRAGSVRFIGGRCNDKNPPKDPQTGRNVSSSCFDTNPGTWHLAMVNQLGASQRSLVLDVTYDYEVWNQPVYGYQYSYFNPQTLAATSVPTQAKVSVQQFTRDKFKRFRSPLTRSIIGIRMQVRYVVETMPAQRASDSQTQDAITTVEYQYDLELDVNNRIIGGEWYTNRHPDFLWTAVPGAKALTRYERLATDSWSADQALPPSWRVAAQQASSNDSSPLAKIVERLIELANQ